MLALGAPAPAVSEAAFNDVHSKGLMRRDYYQSN